MKMKIKKILNFFILIFAFKLMSVPKKQKTSSKTRKGRSHEAIKKKSLSSCSKCGRKKLTHSVCSFCGVYKRAQAKETTSKK